MKLVSSKNLFQLISRKISFSGAKILPKLLLLPALGLSEMRFLASWVPFRIIALLPVDRLAGFAKTLGSHPKKRREMPRIIVNV